MVADGALIAAATASFLTVAILRLTQRLHGRLTLDSAAGVQKLHRRPTLRVGGLGVAMGAGLGAMALRDEAAALAAPVLLAALPAFAAGLAEDLTKRAGIAARLAATLAAGLVFVLLTGTGLGPPGLPGLDAVLGWAPLSALAAVVAVGGMANALNLTDGVNGLAAGSAIVILGGLALLAGQAGDAALARVCLMLCGALAGFFVMNFPGGHIFLGDGGAYGTGAVLAALALLLPARNPEMSSLTGLMALAYPVTETLVSIQRRLARRGRNPGRADRLHLHSLVHRGPARRLARRLGRPGLQNGLSAVLIWPLPLASVLLALASGGDALRGLAGGALVGGLYLAAWRRVALLPVPGRRQGRWLARRLAGLAAHGQLDQLGRHLVLPGLPPGLLDLGPLGAQVALRPRHGFDAGLVLGPQTLGHGQGDGREQRLVQQPFPQDGGGKAGQRRLQRRRGRGGGGRPDAPRLGRLARQVAAAHHPDRARMGRRGAQERVGQPAGQRRHLLDMAGQVVGPQDGRGQRAQHGQRALAQHQQPRPRRAGRLGGFGQPGGIGTREALRGPDHHHQPRPRGRGGGHRHRPRQGAGHGGGIGGDRRNRLTRGGDMAGGDAAQCPHHLADLVKAVQAALDVLGPLGHGPAASASRTIPASRARVASSR